MAKSPRSFRKPLGEFNEVQLVEEIAQDQLCNSRDRHDKDFLEMQIDQD